VSLTIDPSRHGVMPETGIFIRAKTDAGRWVTCDISELDKSSLLSWLRSRGGDNVWAENVVGILLGFGNLHDKLPDIIQPVMISETEDGFIAFCRANPDIATAVVGRSIKKAKVAPPWRATINQAGICVGRDRNGVASVRSETRKSA
jgi:hypothetical protein